VSNIELVEKGCEVLEQHPFDATALAVGAALLLGEGRRLVQHLEQRLVEPLVVQFGEERGVVVPGRVGGVDPAIRTTVQLVDGQERRVGRRHARRGVGGVVGHEAPGVQERGLERFVGCWHARCSVRPLPAAGGGRHAGPLPG